MTEHTSRTDMQLQSDVLEELRWNTRVRSTDIGVAVRNGIVTLTGSVPSWAERLAAKESAHRVRGVLDVANDIVVKLPGTHERDDADIAATVRRALEWDVLVPDERITTTVTNGVVTLEGSVDFWSEYDDAARAVRNLRGVREVKNFIVVEPPKLAEQKVRSSIDGALERHAEHAAKHVRITIAGDKVVLSGMVPSWAERRAVEGAVRGTPGVRRVDNQLRIEA